MRREAWTGSLMVATFIVTASPVFSESASIENPPAHLKSLLLYEGGPQLTLGSGVKLATGDDTAPCVASVTADPNSADRGITSHTVISEVVTTSQFSNAMEISAYASVFGYGARITNNASFSSETRQNKQRSQLVIRVDISGRLSRLRNLGDIQPSPAALQLMKIDPSGSLFASACGDSLVTTVEEGAHLAITFSFDSSSEGMTDLMKNTLQASFSSNEINAELQRKLENYSNATNLQVDVLQIGGTDQPIGKINDARELIEFARLFRSRVTASNVKPKRVTFMSYSSIAPFVAAQGAELLKFNSTFTTMNNLVAAYKLANDRQRFVASALSSPNEFEGDALADVPALKRYQELVASQVVFFSKAAESCANNVKEGKVCDSPTELDVAPLPDIRQLPICSPSLDSLSADDGCKRKKRIGKICYCTRCTFGAQQEQVFTGAVKKDVCSQMQPGAKARVTYRGEVIVNPFAPVGRNIDSHVVLHLGGSAGDYNRPNNSTLLLPFEGQEVVPVPANGEVTSSIFVQYCASNSRGPSETCTIKPRSNSSSFIDVRVEQ
jgi:hypothetical protein